MPSIARMTSEERRAAIVEAAVRLFAERGFRGTTTRALAEAVGVSEPVLYEHFRSKRDLYCAIIETKCREGIARGTTLLERYTSVRDDRGFFVTLGRLVLQRYAEDAEYARLLLYAALEGPELGKLFYEQHCKASKALAGYIALRIRERAFRAVAPALAARAFLAMFSHHGMMGVLYRDDLVKATPKEVVEGMVDIFLRGIARQRGDSK